MFLLKAGLGKDAFVATGVMVAVMVDIARLLTYGWEMSWQAHHVEWPLVVAASISAFAGSYVGARVLEKVMIRSIQVMVSALLVVISLGLVSGLL